MNIQSIHTEADYNNAMERLEVIFDAELNTPEGDELEILAGLIETYEDTHFPIE